MTPASWKEAMPPAALVQELSAHRLLPVYELLVSRGLLRADLGPVAASLSDTARARTAVQTRLEETVLCALADAGIELLVLKGALLARTVYPSPESRFRTDLDLMIRVEQLEQTGARLSKLGYTAKNEVDSGIPVTQKSFVGEVDGIWHGVDVHWDLSQRAVLKRRIPFDALWSRRTPVPGLGSPCAGLSPGDALLHAVMHYFAHYRGQVRIDGWILDFDLLWRHLDESARSATCERAIASGIASLLGATLKISAETFATPVDPGCLQQLSAYADREPSARLLRGSSWGMSEILRSAWEEPDRADGMRLIVHSMFPVPAYMRSKYPDAQKWALPWLYVRRVWDGWRGKG